jgi:iron complex outermembrane receptor protein
MAIGSLLGTFLAGTAVAQSAPAADASSELQEVVVTGRYEFLSADTKGATGLPLPIEQVPQSIGLVSADFIQAANLKTLGDIASYTPGAVNAGNPENNGTVINIRGFAAGRAIDGINAISTYNSYEPDFAVFDRLEVVEGPSSVVYGVSSAGGLVNYVTKSATNQTPSYLYAQGGSWNSYRLEGQLVHALDSNRVRLIGLAAVDNGDSFTDGMYHRKFVIYGGVNVDFTNTLSGYLHAGYEWYKRPAFDGIPTYADGTPAPLPRSFFLGSPDIVLQTKTYYATGDLTWKPNEVLELGVKANLEDSGLTGGNSYGFGLDDAGNVSFAVSRFNGVQRTRNYGVGADSIIHFDSFGLKDSFLSLAALYQDSHQVTDTQYPSDNGLVNVFDGQAAVTTAFNNLYFNDSFPYEFPSVTDTKTFTLSAQSVTKFFDRLSVLLGVSYSKPKVDTTIFGFTQNYDFAGQTSYRAGLTYEILPRTNAYVSYSESFNPQPYLDVNNRVLPPVSGKQYEAGIKYRPGGRLLLTGALYRIVQADLATYDQTVDGIDYYKALGEVTHKGFELKALGAITQEWQVNAGYAYLDPKITRDADPTAVGQTQLFLPKNTFSLYTTYALPASMLKGLTVGGGVRYVDSVKTAYDNSTKDIGSYTIADANIAYDSGPWLVSLIVSNVFDEKYFINNYQTLYYGNYPGAPRSFTLSVRRTFGQ